MIYYLLKQSSESILQCATDEQGRGLAGIEKVRPWHVTRAYAKLIESAVAIFPDRVPAMTHYPILSRRFKDALTEVRVCESIHFIPLTILNKQGTQILNVDGYFLGYATKAYDLLDLPRAEVTFYKGTCVVDQVLRWALKEDEIPELDLFFNWPTNWFATDRFKEFVESYGFTGCRFMPIYETYEPGESR